MEDNKIKVGMGEYAIGNTDDILITYGLGSCVGLTIHDEKNKLGGLAHIMLPSSEFAKGKEIVKKGKYADIAIRELIALLISRGGDLVNFQAKIFGGAKMFSFETERNGVDIGGRNVTAVKEELKKQRVNLIVEIVGDDFGRTIEFEIDTGKVKVVSVNKPIIII